MRGRERGYTLVELLIVLVVIGIMLGLVSLALRDDRDARLARDADRLETLFALAAEEAQLTSRPITWRGDENGYAFYQRDRDRWVPLAGDAQFKERAWDLTPMRLVLAAADVPRWSNNGLPNADGTTEIAFPRDGAQVAFTLTLEVDDRKLLLKGDGAGRYWVERPS